MSASDLSSIATLLEHGQAADARRLLDDLVAHLPTYVAAHVLLAKIAESEHRFDEALAHWRAAYDLNPQSRVIEDGLRREVLRTLSLDESGTGDRNEALDLDHLIRELEAARIIPDPDVVAISEYELEDDLEDLVSETLARIYASQHHYWEAKKVYETLARQHPGRKNEFEAKAIEMDRLAQENDVRNDQET